jgi:hypothetical protein
MAPCNFEGIPDLTDSCGKVSGVFFGIPAEVLRFIGKSDEAGWPTGPV